MITINRQINIDVLMGQLITVLIGCWPPGDNIGCRPPGDNIGCRPPGDNIGCRSPVDNIGCRLSV